MNDDLDAGLLARFTAARTTPLDQQFVARLLTRIEAERRRARRRQYAWTGALLLLLAWNLPALLAFTARLADNVVATLVVLPVHAASTSPGISSVGWAVSLAVGALVLWRTPSLRRRR